MLAYTGNESHRNNSTTLRSSQNFNVVTSRMYLKITLKSRRMRKSTPLPNIGLAMRLKVIHEMATFIGLRSLLQALV